MGCGASAPLPVDSANNANKPAASARPPAAPKAAGSSSKPPAKPAAAQPKKAEHHRPADTTDDDDDADMPDAPPVSVVERPTTSGGRAFDLSFQNDDAVRKPPPARLKKLESQAKKKNGDLTIQELQAKMAAAEDRRKNYESKLKEKMQAENGKIQQVQRQKTKIEMEGGPVVHNPEEDREHHLKDLRDKLHQK